MLHHVLGVGALGAIVLRCALLLPRLLRLLLGGGSRVLTDLLHLEQHGSQVLRHARTVAGVGGRGRGGFGGGVGDLCLRLELSLERLRELLGRHGLLLGSFELLLCGSTGLLLSVDDRAGEALVELPVQLEDRLDLVPLLQQVGSLAHVGLRLGQLAPLQSLLSRPVAANRLLRLCGSLRGSRTRQVLLLFLAEEGSLERGDICAFGRGAAGTRQ